MKTNHSHNHTSEEVENRNMDFIHCLPNIKIFLKKGYADNKFWLLNKLCHICDPTKNFQSCWKGLLAIISVTLNAGICLVDLQKNAKTVFSKWVFTVSGSQLFIIFSSLIGGPV